MVKHVEAVFFDLDGVLANTEGPDGLHNVAWNAALEKFNYHLSDVSESAIKELDGRRPREIAQIMVRDLGISVDPEEIYNEKISILMAKVHNELRSISGAKSAVRKLHNAGYKIAIVTSTDYADTVVKKFGISNYIDALVMGGMVKMGKPAPDSYLKAAELLHVDPVNCVVFEDMPNGVESGIAAGATVVGVFNKKAPQDLSKAHKQVSSLRSVTPEFVEQVAAQRKASYYF